MIRTSSTYASLSRPHLLLGGEYKLVVGNIGMGAFFALFGAPWFLLATLVLHVFIVQLSKRDPAISKVYMVYAKQGDRYEPWTDAAPHRGNRPLVLIRDGVLL